MRVATLEDIPALEQLIARSAWGLASRFYDNERVAAALGSAWGVDTQLLRDGTYFVIEDDDELAICGGWSFRATEFGADARADRDARQLDPAREPARIRAFFVNPLCARRGLGRQLLAHCEAQARAHGFREALLIATLSGEAFYEAHGYAAETPFEHPVAEALTIRFVPMRKKL